MKQGGKFINSFPYLGFYFSGSVGQGKREKRITSSGRTNLLFLDQIAAPHPVFLGDIPNPEVLLFHNFSHFSSL